MSIYAAAGAGKAGAYDKIVSMRELKIVTEVKVYKYAELPDEYRKAVDAAKAKGTVLAEASGKALGEVLNVEEYQDDQYGRYVSSSINMSRASGAVAEATMADMGVMPGEMDVEAVIRVEFALTDSQ